MNWNGAKTPAPRPLGVDSMVCADMVPAPVVWTSGRAAGPAGTRGPFDQMFLEPRQRQGLGSRGEIQKLGEVSSGSLCGHGHCALKVDLGCVRACAHVCACVRPEVSQAILWHLLHVLNKPRCQVLRLPGLGTRIGRGQGCIPSNAWRGGSCLLSPLPWMLAVFGLQIHPRDPVSSWLGPPEVSVSSPLRRTPVTPVRPHPNLLITSAVGLLTGVVPH